MDKLLYTIDETAEALRMSRSTIYRLLKSGHLVSVKVGTSRRISRQALDNFVVTLDKQARHEIAQRWTS